MKNVILIFTILSSFMSLAHKSYISIADMAYNPKKERVEVSLKVTAHDFEYVLEKHFNKKVELESIEKNSKEDQFIMDYLKKHFVVKSNNQQAVMNYLGFEVNERDDLYFYFSFTQISNFKQILVTNTVLFETFEQQQNIVHYKVNDKTKSVTLAKKTKTGRFTY